jgi:hypothetical protein
VLVGRLVDEGRLDEEGVDVDAGLCVLALATALSMSFLRIGAAAFCVNSSSCSASPPDGRERGSRRHGPYAG